MRALPIDKVALPTSGNLAFGAQRSATHVHRGIDLPRPEGTPVFAIADGVVEYASDRWQQGFSGYGAHVVIAHGDGSRALYAHLQSVTVAKGLRVHAGEIIGRVGKTAFTRENHEALLASGPHLHLEISPRPYPQPSESTRLDPVAYLKGAVSPRVARAIALVARSSSLDVALLRALAWVESRWNPAAESQRGGSGLFGFTPAQAKVLGIDPKDPEQATSAAASVLRRAFDRTGTIASALAAFVWGLENVEQHPSSAEWPAPVEMFVAEVLGRYADERKALGAIPLGEEYQGAARGSL